ncbi:hypothetical protein BKP57_08775 [Virgibacillus sp. 6R]|nr:hypothetical protein BKP57_08775 [Virgibacillus sp. 6R]
MKDPPDRRFTLPTCDSAVVVRFSIPLSGSLGSIIVDTVKQASGGKTRRLLENELDIFFVRCFADVAFLVLWESAVGRPCRKKANFFF